MGVPRPKGWGRIIKDSVGNVLQDGDSELPMSAIPEVVSAVQGRPRSSSAGSAASFPHARMGRMFLTSGWMRCAEVRSAGPCCCAGEGTAR